MRILAVSRSFLPTLGGVETAADALTRAWAAVGHVAIIATETPGEASPRPGIEVLRQPSAAALLAATRRADLVWHNHLSLRAAWALGLAPRPWVITHQSWLRREDGRLGPRFRLKRQVARLGCNVAISKAIAADLPAPSAIIPNPYRDELFRDLAGPRPFDLAFLGRLVSVKGGALLIEALAQLKTSGRIARLLLIGDGPERERLQQAAAALGVASQIEMAGALAGEALVRALNRARILVVPSLYDEPFGIVALEGIACGCAVIASAGGGLTEAVGPCGLIFPNGDASALARAIGELLASPERQGALLRQAPSHLSNFTADAVARRYLALFESLLRS
jgi:glycosyltransferase involved in cell wall biosynthesis